MSQKDSHSKSGRSLSEESKALLESIETKLNEGDALLRRAQIHFARARAIREGRPLPPLPEELPHQG